jgi:excisionase family DNA binding protein
VNEQQEPKKWLSVADVSEKLGLTEERVRQLIRMKKIRATKIGGWLVDPEDLDTFLFHRTNMNRQYRE